MLLVGLEEVLCLCSGYLEESGSVDGETYGTWTGGDGVGVVEWYRGAVGVFVLRRVSSTVILIPLGRSN